MKNKPKYTPGHWIIEENVNHYPFIIGEDNNTIAMLFNISDGSLPYGRTLEETTGNAKLIAAAPELLEELKNMLFAFSASAESEIQKKAVEYARMLIQKHE